MTGIVIADLHFVGENERGITYEFENLRTGTHVLGYRRAESINGRHYHSGRSASKSPEVFLLLSGNVRLHARNLDTGEEMETEISAPRKVEIYPRVWHEIVAISDIVFVEWNSIEEHATDTDYDGLV